MSRKIILSREEIEKAYRTKNLNDAAELLGVSVLTLRKRMGEHGMISHSHGWKPETAIDKEVLIKMYETHSVPEIADILRVDRKTVYARLRDYGIKMKPTGRQSHFTPPERELHDLYVSKKLSVVEVADHYGVSQQVIVHRLAEIGMSDKQIEHERERRKRIEAKERLSSSAKMWKRAILQRDDFKCRKCGLQAGKCDHCGQHVFLHAHHIKPIKTHLDLRYVLSNGMTLCRTCHAKEHKK